MTTAKEKLKQAFTDLQKQESAIYYQTQRIIHDYEDSYVEMCQQRDDLLVALKEFLIIAETAWIEDYFGNDWERGFEQARAAIASATDDGAQE